MWKLFVGFSIGMCRISGSAGYPIRQCRTSGRISGIRQVPDIRQILEYSGCIDYREISKIIVLSYFVLYFRVEVKYPAENPAISGNPAGAGYPAGYPIRQIIFGKIRHPASGMKKLIRHIPNHYFKIFDRFFH